jgi:hypothetical protein
LRDEVAGEVLGGQHDKMTELRNADVIGGDYSVRTPADKSNLKLKGKKYGIDCSTVSRGSISTSLLEQLLMFAGADGFV